MNKQFSQLNQVSMVTRNFGDAAVFENILHDWFQFLGGKPGEVVVIDGGSNLETQSVYWRLFQEGLIDKLQVIQPNHEEHNHERGYIQIHTAGAIASKPYLLWFTIDTLPYREGHDNWLEEAIGYLERDDVFAVGGSFNMPSKHHDAWSGWYLSHKCSLNFTLMKRSTYMAAVYEFAATYVASGFQGENPAQATGQSRFLLEVALERYMQRHNVYTLCKVEDPSWTIFHTNTHEERLKKTRDKYLARKDIERFMNAGLLSEEKPIHERLIYYGQPQIGIVKKLRIIFGQSSVGSYWRWLRQRLLLKFRALLRLVWFQVTTE
ncbi:glycosyltransferase [Chroococcidiopsis sp. CCMEE 29]|uniref:glycosyltransferase family 2 protein n=1 Tax=Chroococcidiopsis sp. CCMEE 29 TaxID=155894 RepID=UPI00202280A6|nr:glycosyltransferase [Chroococcidiopsis sp. CCMEE 29]